MVYSNRFVLCILINGQVQKELANGTVKIPFGSEYAIRARNKNPSRAVVKIFVDGENVSGNGYVVPANDHIDIERHHDKDRAFKFVDLDSPEAVDAGKNGPNDDKEKGTIEVRFFMEKVINAPVTPWVSPNIIPKPWKSPSPFDKPYDHPILWGQPPSYDYNHDILRCFASADASASSRAMTDTKLSLQSCSLQTPQFGAEIANADGCTVEGNLTGQNFSTTYIITENDYVSLRVFLQGYVADKVYTHTTTKVNFCESCGTKKKKSANFCSNCGLKF